MSISAQALLDDIAVNYRASLVAEAMGDVMAITTANTLHDGTPVTVYVESDNGQFLVSDRGLIADHLDTAGVDLSRPNVAESWRMIRAGVGFPAAFGSEDWELTAWADSTVLAAAIQAVADSAIRGDALRVLARGYAPPTFAARVTSMLGRKLAIVPKATMPGRHGQARTVTCAVGSVRPRFVQALSGGASKNQSFDHAVSLWFGSSVDKDYRVSLLQNRGADWEPWQLAQLGDTSRTVTERAIDALIDEIERSEFADQPTSE